MFGTLFLLATSSLGGAGTDFMTEIRADQMLCSNPDLSTKTCSAIATFILDENGNATETAELLISPSPPITLEMSTSVEIRGSVNCSKLTLAQMQKGRLRVNGTLLPSEQNEAALSKITAMMASMADKRACDELRIEAGQLIKIGQVDGIEIKLPGKPVSWISKNDGFKVAPR